MNATSFLRRAFGLLFGQNGAADELALVQRDEEAQARLDGRGVLVQLVAVKRVTNLGAQRVARAQPGRLQPVRLAGSQQLVPNRLDALARRHDLKPVLARVAGARDPDRAASMGEAGNLVLLQIRHPRHAACRRWTARESSRR